MVKSPRVVLNLTWKVSGAFSLRSAGFRSVRSYSEAAALGCAGACAGAGVCARNDATNKNAVATASTDLVKRMMVVSSKEWERRLVQRFYEEIVYRNGADRNGREERGTVTPRPGRGRRRSQREEHRGHRGRKKEGRKERKKKRKGLHRGHRERRIRREEKTREGKKRK